MANQYYKVKEKSTMDVTGGATFLSEGLMVMCYAWTRIMYLLVCIAMDICTKVETQVAGNWSLRSASARLSVADITLKRMPIGLFQSE